MHQMKLFETKVKKRNRKVDIKPSDITHFRTISETVTTIVQFLSQMQPQMQPPKLEHLGFGRSYVGIKQIKLLEAQRTLENL